MSQREENKILADQAAADQAAETLRAFANEFRTNSNAKNAREDFISAIAAETMESMALMFQKAGRLDVKPSDFVDGFVDERGRN